MTICLRAARTRKPAHLKDEQIVAEVVGHELRVRRLAVIDITQAAFSGFLIHVPAITPW